MATEADRRARIARSAGRDTGRGYQMGDRKREITPGQAAGGAARGARQGTRAVTYRRPVGSKHVLTAELVAGLLIVLVRIVADYEPQADGTVKGKIGHPKGQYGPLPIAAGLIASFFLLSFFVAKGGRWATTANAFGGLLILGLALKSVDEFSTVAATFPTWGKATKPAGAWESTGVPAGDLVDGSDSSSSGSGSGKNTAPPGIDNPPLIGPGTPVYT